MGVEFQKAHGPWTLSSAHGRAMSQSRSYRKKSNGIPYFIYHAGENHGRKHPSSLGIRLNVKIYNTGPILPSFMLPAILDDAGLGSPSGLHIR